MSLVKEDPTLTLDFEWDGKTVHKETSGFTGPDCEKLTSFIEEGLKANKGTKKYKAEFVKTEKKNTLRLNS